MPNKPTHPNPSRTSVHVCCMSRNYALLSFCLRYFASMQVLALVACVIIQVRIAANHKLSPIWACIAQETARTPGIGVSRSARWIQSPKISFRPAQRQAVKKLSRRIYPVTYKYRNFRTSFCHFFLLDHATQSKINLDWLINRPITMRIQQKYTPVGPFRSHLLSLTLLLSAAGNLRFNNVFFQTYST